MEPSNYDEITLCNTVLFQRYGTTGGIKEMGSHNRSANGHSATAALYVNPIHARSYSYLVNFSETCSTYPKHKSFIGYLCFTSQFMQLLFSSSHARSK
jgi:hypothetical protein